MLQRKRRRRSKSEEMAEVDYLRREDAEPDRTVGEERGKTKRNKRSTLIH